MIFSVVAILFLSLISCVNAAPANARDVVAYTCPPLDKNQHSLVWPSSVPTPHSRPSPVSTFPAGGKPSGSPDYPSGNHTSYDGKPDGGKHLPCDYPEGGHCVYDPSTGVLITDKSTPYCPSTAQKK